MSVRATQPLTWRQEFPADYAVPDAIANHPELEDTSWHNDVCPSFTVKGYDGDNGDDVRLWVNHPDPTAREFPEQRRLTVYDQTGIYYESERGDADADKAIAAVLAATAQAVERRRLENLADDALRAEMHAPRAFNPRYNGAALLFAELKRRGLTS